MTAATKLIYVDPEKVRFRSQDVLEVLTRNDRPMTTNAIIKELGAETNPENVKMIASRAGYLVLRGLATRVMNGTYRAAAEGHAIAARISHDVHNDPVVNSVVPQTPPAQVAVNVVIESIDDTIEAVLDLLLPNGFRAADLRFIAPWVETTKSMIAQVQR